MSRHRARELNDNNVVNFEPNQEPNSAQYLYQVVFKVARHFIQQSKVHSIDVLLSHNDPTYEEIAEITKNLADLMQQLADVGGWNEERIAANAKQASLHMSEMATAIVNNDEDALELARNNLEKISFI